MEKKLLGWYDLVCEVVDYDSSSDVVTPLDLARQMVRNLPTSGRMLIPGSGIGTFAIAAVLEGRNPNTITCIDYNKRYHALATRFFAEFGITFIYGDYLSWETNMKFDVIIGNPPYQEVTETGRKDQASNLWSKFWIKSLRLLNDDGYAALITPTSWMSPSANLRGEYKYEGCARLWDVFNMYSSVAQVTGVESYFKGINSSFGIVTVNKGGKEGLSFQEGYDSSLGFLPKSNIEEVISKIGGEVTLASKYEVSQNPKSGWRVSVPLTRKVSEDNIEVLSEDALPCKGSSKPGLYAYVHVPGQKEAHQVKQSIVPCIDVLNVHCRWSGFMNLKIFGMVNYESN